MLYLTDSRSQLRAGLTTAGLITAPTEPAGPAGPGGPGACGGARGSHWAALDWRGELVANFIGYIIYTDITDIILRFNGSMESMDICIYIYIYGFDICIIAYIINLDISITNRRSVNSSG